MAELFGKDGLCTEHQRPYTDCGPCRAETVRAMASVSEEEVQKDWNDEDKKRERVLGALRAVQNAQERLSDALAHVKLDTVGVIPANAASEIGDCQHRLRVLERELMRADSKVMRDHFGLLMEKRLPNMGEMGPAEG